MIVFTLFACKVRFSYFENSKLPILKILDMRLEVVPPVLISNITCVNTTTVKSICKKIGDLDILIYI
jgi:hypothetical protein